MSLTIGINPGITSAVAAMPDEWMPIHHPDTFGDQLTGELISDAQVTETTSAAFTGRPGKQQVSGRLIV